MFSNFKALGLVLCIFLLNIQINASAQSILKFESDSTYNSRLEIEIGQNEISGLCAMRVENGTYNGCIINEFGIKAFDFTYNVNSHKLKLIYVSPNINRWLIRKTLKKDLQQILASKSEFSTSKYKLCKHNQDIFFKNLKHHITYHFFPLNETTE